MTDFSDKQRAVLDVLSNTRESVLVTGVAGCGKSTIIREWLGNTSTARTMLLAPTGIAALNVGGSTIHRAFGFMPGMNADNPRITLKVKSLLYTTETIVVDEVSMVRADLLHSMDVVMRSVKHKLDVPFGGVRMVFVGDFYQLPPVVRQEEERYMEQKHGSRAGWMFLSPVFKKLNPRVFYLAQSFRQAGDGSFTDLLNQVRNLDPNSVNAVNEIAKRAVHAGEEIPRLCSTKKLVAQHNYAGLQRLGKPAYVLEPKLDGDLSKIPADAKESTTLAEGARVMITSNGAGYVNGSLGTLLSFEATAETWQGAIVSAIAVRLDAGYDVTVPQHLTEVFGYEVSDDNENLEKVVIASVTQYPLMLAYGYTIHKSQGQTLDRAVIDLGRGAFAHGQTYVALSRLRSADGLYLSQPLTRSDLLLDPDVVEFCKSHTV